VSLDESVGLGVTDRVFARMFFPWEENLGGFRWGRTLSVEVLPFRAALLAVGRQLDEPGTDEGPFQVVPGPEGSEQTVVPLQWPEHPYHYSLGALESAPVPEFAEALFEATCFAADNNALEVRSLLRSGPSAIPQVTAAREFFVNKPMFVNRAIWDRNLFDGDITTFFTARLADRMFRLDLGEAVLVDEIILKIRDRQYPELNAELERFSEDAYAEVSADLVSWERAPLESGGVGTTGRIRILNGTPVRYIRVRGAPRRLAEVEGYYRRAALDRSRWRASNLFFEYAERPAIHAFRTTFTLDRVAPGGYLALAINGTHGHERAWAALRVNGDFVGAPDRAVSFDSNTWEYYNVELDHDYTYYFPADESYVGQEIEAWVLILDGGSSDVEPEAWKTAYPIPWQKGG